MRPIWRDPSKPFLGTQQLTAVLPSQILSALKITKLHITQIWSTLPSVKEYLSFFIVQGLGSIACCELLVLVQTCFLLYDVISGFEFWLQNMGRAIDSVMVDDGAFMLVVLMTVMVIVVAMMIVILVWILVLDRGSGATSGNPPLSKRPQATLSFILPQILYHCLWKILSQALANIHS